MTSVILIDCGSPAPFLSLSFRWTVGLSPTMGIFFATALCSPVTITSILVMVKNALYKGLILNYFKGVRKVIWEGGQVNKQQWILLNEYDT